MRQKLVEQYREQFNNPVQAAEKGYIDDINKAYGKEGSYKHIYIDIAIAWAFQAFVGTLIFAKYIEGKSLDD